MGIRDAYGRIEPLLQRALQIQETTLGRDHFEVARTLQELAKLYATQASYGRAESLLQRALRIQEAILGKDHPSVGYTLNTLGGVYWFQGSYGLWACRTAVSACASDPRSNLW
jgi:hypothetical protein